MHFEDLEESFPSLYSSEAIHSSALKIEISSSYIVIPAQKQRRRS
jgi:hypothetical protein